MNRILMLHAVTGRERKDATSFIFDTVNGLGGWIDDAHMYSNIMNTIRLTLPAGQFAALGEALKAGGITVDMLPEALSTERPEAESMATLQVTFVHDEPDMRRDVPAVPG